MEQSLCFPDYCQNLNNEAGNIRTQDRKKQALIKVTIFVKNKSPKNGFSQGPLELYERKKEVVVSPHNRHIGNIWTYYRIKQRQCNSAIYLHLVLKVAGNIIPFNC